LIQERSNGGKLKADLITETNTYKHAQIGDFTVKQIVPFTYLTHTYIYTYCTYWWVYIICLVFICTTVYM